MNKTVNLEFNGERFVPLEELMKDEIAIEHFHRYHAVVNLVKGKRVLDIACGEGYGSALLSTTAEKIYGVDIDPVSIQHAREQYGKDHPTIEFIEGNAINIPLTSKSVDIVVCFETIEHLTEETQHLFLSEIKRVLVADGLLVISTPDKANYSDRFDHNNEFHQKEFTKDEFALFLKGHFGHVSTFLQGFEIVSAITSEEMKSIRDTKVLDWDRNDHQFSRKYLIAICSNTALDKKATLNSVVFQGEKDYLKIMDKVIENENRIEELGAWGKGLDTEVAARDKIIKHYQGENKELEARESNKTQQLDSLNKDKEYLQSVVRDQLAALTAKFEDVLNQKILLEKLQSDLADKDSRLLESARAIQETKDRLAETNDRLTETAKQLTEAAKQLKEGEQKAAQAQERLEKELAARISELTTQQRKTEQQATELRTLQFSLKDHSSIIEDQKQRIGMLDQQLAGVNGRLNEIYASEGWKLLKVYYNFKGRMIPENSDRYRLLKRMFNKLRGKKEIEEYGNVRHANPAMQLPVAEPKVVKAAPVFDIIELPNFERPIVSIIIPAYNGWPINYQCIKAIRANTPGVAYEVILADDSSTDETKEVDRFIKNVVVVRNETNLGFLHNCNHAAEAAKGKYIVFLNNDTEVKEDWLSPMVALMEKDETVGMTGSKLIYPNGQLQEAGGILWKDASAWNFGHKQDPNASEFNYVKEADYISGASIMIRTSLWKKIGGFDQRYAPAYCEDSDFAFEVRKRGYKVVYQPLSEVVHYEGYSHGSDSNGEIKEGSIKKYQEINLVKFKDKWKSVLQEQHFPNGEKVFWARDRSSTKKTILVIDHYVPHFDKDAGSRTVFQYLRLFVSMGYNVKFIGDNYYRHEPYTTVLQQMGIEVLYGPWYANNWQQWIKNNSEYIDFILLNRPHISIKYIDFIKANTRATLLYYGHDLHFMRELKQYEIEKRPELLESSAIIKETEMHLFNSVDIVLTPSEDERKLIEELGVKSKVTAIKPYIFESFPATVPQFTKRKDILFVGGFTHTPNKDGVIWFVKEVWPLVRDKISGGRFIIAGSNVPAEIASFASNDIIVRGFVTDKELQELYHTVRQVVVPLRYGAGVKGKTVEALYNGLPIVTTDFGVEGLPGDSSFIPPQLTAEAFAQEVIRLYNASEAELSALSNREINYIRDNFHFDVVKGEMLIILSSSSAVARAPLIN